MNFTEENEADFLKFLGKITGKTKVGRPKETPSIEGRNFFLTVPHFSGTLDMVIEALKMHQPNWDYLKYAMVKQTHKDEDKGTHLHLYLSYPKKLHVKLDRFDYLGKHGKLERVRNYRSVLNYMTKEARPRSNFDYIEQIMRKDFGRAVDILLQQGWSIREVYKKYSSIVVSKNWQGYLRFKIYSIESDRIQAQLDKPGLQMITPELIKARLSTEELKLYYSSPLYQKIIDLINDIVVYGSNRPHKSKILLLTGPPNMGKTTFVLFLAKMVGTYLFPDDGWFAGYESNVFKLIQWEQFDLTRMRYPNLLKFLQGLPMNLPVKGAHVYRADNPLIITTSNLRLDDHICARFSSQENREHSRANLAARIEEIVINEPIFFLTKLLLTPLEKI